MGGRVGVLFVLAAVVGSSDAANCSKYFPWLRPAGLRPWGGPRTTNAWPFSGSAELHFKVKVQGSMSRFKVLGQGARFHFKVQDQGSRSGFKVGVPGVFRESRSAFQNSIKILRSSKVGCSGGVPGVFRGSRFKVQDQGSRSRSRF